ncbi:type II toxin-antitoxin system VapB family antitoxin [Kitasatospora aureofaciens]|uniref:type II toxin-antitoxin system VapB family antitoxin n=1 Tax=Kitasatospora aureofaciens TaxID=1894 RepID=UPI0036F48E59
MAEAAGVLGATTAAATVNAALEDVVKRRTAGEFRGTTTEAAAVRPSVEEAARRRKAEQFLAWLADGGLPGLTGPVEQGM